MRSNLLSAVLLTGIAGANAHAAWQSGRAPEWAGTALLTVIALVDARRVWRALGRLS